MNELSSRVTATLRLICYVLLTLALMPVQLLLNATGSKYRKILPSVYHRLCLKINGIKIIRRGRPVQDPSTLYIANHTSYMDILVLGSLLKASFVAKDEVAKWPFFGWCAKLQETVFINRQSRDALTHAGEIQARLSQGDSIILFPEGTTGDGQHILPFKSALFSVAQLHDADGKPVTVQPVSIAYARLDGLPMGRAFRPNYAWYGDMEMADHLFFASGLGKITIIVELHKPVNITQFTSRKALSDYCHEQISDAVAEGICAKAQRRPFRDRLLPDLLNEQKAGKKRLTDPL